MSTITLRGLSDKVAAEVRRLAAKEGKSMNRCLIELVEASLLGDASGKPREHHDLDHLFGTLSADDARCLDQSISEGRGIDEELWR